MRHPRITQLAAPLMLAGLLAIAPNAMAETADFGQRDAAAPTLGESLAADLESYEQSHRRVQVQKDLTDDAGTNPAAIDLAQLRADLAAYYGNSASDGEVNAVTSRPPRFVQNLSNDLEQFERANGDLSGL